ncbi:hypothetical protein MU852_11290 [Brevundimonas albigilva]|uniref:hypothetical protein n=1 Tax=Brevundimonas albigilva TaxID=1312364 RepID=UPI00201B75AA|nr:hypothetical protein [Brevundimonas albigilva]UQV17471.1 hypothetical protein MU852_11290 [Brevundimonas albigilva]
MSASAPCIGTTASTASGAAPTAPSGAQVGPGRLLIGGNIQDRRNPKQKKSWRYDEPGAELNDTEIQSDVRDGTDYSANLSYEVPVAGGDLQLSGVFVRTDRVQDENSLEYNEGIEDADNLAKVNANPLDILTDNWSVNGRYEREMLGGETTFKLGYATIDDEQFEQEEELDVEDQVIEGARTRTNVKDEEIQRRDRAQDRAERRHGAGVRRPVFEEGPRHLGVRGRGRGRGRAGFPRPAG